MLSSTIARFAALPSAAILLWICLGGPWTLAVGAIVLPRRAAAQATAALSPVEKEQLFQRFQEMQGDAGKANATPDPAPAPVQRSRSPAIQPPPPARPARSPAALEPTPAPPAPVVMWPLSPSATARRVVIHVSAGSATETLSARLLAELDPQFDRVELRRVAATPSRPSIRWFHREDEAAAQDIAARLSGAGLAWTLRDFSAFRPLPSRGTIEVWLPERA